MTRRNPSLADCPVVLYFPTRAAPTKTVVLRGPDYGHAETLNKRQVRDLSAADEYIVYTRGPKCWDLEMTISFLNRFQRDDLEDFFDDYTDGGAETFELVIPDYSTAMDDGSLTRQTHFTGCEFDMGEIQFTEPNNGFFAVSLQVRASGKAFV